MKIGIILYSYTGNTYSVAKRLEDMLLKAGHSVTTEKLSLVGGTRPKDGSFQIELFPDTSAYDVIIFASPVEAFSLSQVMKSYLDQIETLENKKIACFVTQFFPYPWMGGNRAISQMKNICESKNGSFMGSGVVNWKNKNRDKMINDLVEKFSTLF